MVYESSYEITVSEAQLKHLADHVTMLIKL
jgi:hypothetical protein